MRDTEPTVRMHRTEDPSLPRPLHRSHVLAREGLIASQQPKHSSVIGFGRRSLPSQGVAEALSNAAYGGTLAATAADFAATSAAPPSEGGAEAALHINKSGVVGKTVWDVGAGAGSCVTALGAAMQTQRRAAATSRAADRVFDVTTRPVIGIAVPDPFVRAQRENKEIAASRERPGDRPVSFTATTRQVAALRVHKEKAAEVIAVRALQ